MTRSSLSRILICVTAFGLVTLQHTEAWSSEEPVVACLGTPPNPNPPTYSDDDFSAIHKHLDREICWIDKKDNNLQLLRAGLVIAVSARYAAAAIERYSENREDMALRVIPRINKALDALDRARARMEEKSDSRYIDVYQADLIMRIAELMAVASEPTRSEFRGFFPLSLNLSFAKRAFNLLKNATINELYGGAYRDGFRKHMEGIGSNSNVKIDDYKAITALLSGENGGCKRLKDMAGTGSMACNIPKGIEPDNPGSQNDGK